MVVNIAVGNRYTYKDHQYIATKYDHGHYLTKSHDGSSWHSAVEYKYDGPSSNELTADMVFVRTEDDFKAKFTEVHVVTPAADADAGEHDDAA